ncbi:hypothetical protein ACLJJ6_02620 [Pediococcus siamensis]|uniref:hypothetical protein n=1 Tax=Pediococcus siamensis TaxID=381829 RepID=UPI0039A1001D
MDYKLVAWGIGILILVVLIIFYFSYSKYARQRVERHTVNGLERVIKRTRLILIVLVLILAGDLGYGYFAPHKSLGQINLIERTSQTFQKVKDKFFDRKKKSSAAPIKKTKQKVVKKSTSGMTGKKAVMIVKNYYAKQGTEKEVEKYRFIKTKMSRVSNQKVFEVGGYQTKNGQLVQVHDYEVNKKGKFDLLY